MKRSRGHRRQRHSPTSMAPDGQEEDDTQIPKDFEQQFLASAERLRAAGLIESIDHDFESGKGVVTFTIASHQLMLAGRQIFEEPEFQSVWATGNPTLVRRWLEDEADLLIGQSKADEDVRPKVTGRGGADGIGATSRADSNRRHRGDPA